MLVGPSAQRGQSDPASVSETGPPTSVYCDRLLEPRRRGVVDLKRDRLCGLHLGIRQTGIHDLIGRTSDDQCRRTTATHDFPPDLQADQRKGYGQKGNGCQSQ
jgi:hypothetical protein